MNSPQQHMPGFGVTAWLSAVFLYIPILILVVFSFNAGRLITVWQGFSTEWYAVALDNDELKESTINSLIIGIGSMIFSTLIALGAALALHGRTKKSLLEKTTDFLMPLPLLVPEIVLAVATMSFFSLINLKAGLFNILAAHIVFCIPFAYSPIRARLETIPGVLLEAAGDLYANKRQAFLCVTLPLLMPGITSGALLAFITSLDDFLITQMVAQPGQMTLPVYIYSMVRRGITPEINAISSILLIVSIVFVLSSYLINKRKAG